MPVNDKKKAANLKWDKANLKRISVALPVDLHDRLTRHRESRGETQNGFIKRAIDETISNDEKTEA